MHGNGWPMGMGSGWIVWLAVIVVVAAVFWVARQRRRDR